MEISQNFHGQPTQFRLYSNDKLVVINTSKVASRYIGSIFNQFDKSYLGGNCTNEFYIDDAMDIIPKTEEPQCNKTIGAHDEIHSIINRESKKDIIFLYRNPLERFKSGIIQDFTSLYGDSDNSRYLIWSSLSGNLEDGFISPDVINKVSNSLNYKSLYNRGDILLENRISDKVKLLLEMYLKYNITFEFYKTSHVESYLHKLHYLIFNMGIDLNKVKILDIDEGSDILYKSLMPYFNSNLKDIGKGSNNDLKKYLNTFMTEPENDLYIKSIMNLISTENSFYSTLKKSNLNITK